MSIILIDNYDSFTFNLLHYVQQVTDEEICVVRNDAIALNDVEDYDKIIISPGPGLPKDAGMTLDIIRKFAPTHQILGVCLGHQAIAEVFGAKLANLQFVKHGVTSEIQILTQTKLFSGLPSKIQVGRYHSWVIDKNFLPDDLEITALDHDGQIMAIEHRHFDIYGVQFHPESIMTPNGIQIMRNFVSFPSRPRLPR